MPQPILGLWPDGQDYLVVVGRRTDLLSSYYVFIVDVKKCGLRLPPRRVPTKQTGRALLFLMWAEGNKIP